MHGFSPPLTPVDLTAAASLTTPRSGGRMDGAKRIGKVQRTVNSCPKIANLTPPATGQSPARLPDPSAHSDPPLDGYQPSTKSKHQLVREHSPCPDPMFKSPRPSRSSPIGRPQSGYPAEITGATPRKSALQRGYFGGPSRGDFRWRLFRVGRT